MIEPQLDSAYRPVRRDGKKAPLDSSENVASSEVEPAPPAAANTRGAFSVVLIAGFMALLDVSIVNVALPSIESQLHASSAQVQWIVAGYSLSFGLVLIAAGKLGDIFGRRRLFLVGVAGFALASLGCGLAPTADFLVATRLVQGVFAGILNPQILGLIQDLFVGKARARAFGTYGAMIGVSTAVGPLLGGVLIQLLGPELGWRSVFMINVPIAIVLLPLIVRWLPRSTSERQSFRGILGRLDPIGVLLLGAVVVSIMWPFMERSDAGSNEASGTMVWFFVAAAVLLLLFVGWERIWSHRGGTVLLNRKLMGSASYMIGVATGFSYFAGFTSIFVVATLYMQQGVGFSPLAAGAAQVPFALMAGLSSLIAGRLVSRFGRSIPIVGSTIILTMVAATGLAARFVDPAHVPWIAIILLGFAGFGSGLVISPNQTLTLEAVPRGQAGVGAALLQTMQRIGTSVGVTVVTMVFFIVGAKGGSGAGDAHSQAVLEGFSDSMFMIAGILSLTLVLNLVDRFRPHERSVQIERVG